MINSLHSRKFKCSKQSIMILISKFASEESPLWAYKLWPRDKFDSEIRIGAVGGHGATRYIVEKYDAEKELIFRFIAPKKYIGFHGFRFIEEDGDVVLTHFTSLSLKGYHWLMWHLAIRWVHDALIEDSFDSAELFLTGKVLRPNRWKWRVYFLRHCLGGSRLILEFLRIKKDIRDGKN